MYEDNHKLSKTEVRDLKKQGHDVDENNLYVIKFLFNDKWNDAADPRPFRIKPSLVKKLARDSIGMPYIVNQNNPQKHVRGTDGGKEDTAQGLLEIQAKYAIGEIVAPLISSANNVYGIVKIWPEFENAVLNDELPKFTSPTIFPTKEDADGIDDAQFLNINAVSTPGYPKILAGITGVCKAGIKKCMEELAPLAASGSLNDSRNNLKSFSILKNKLGISMSANPEEKSNSVEKSIKDLQEGLTGLGQKVTGLETKIDDIASKVGAGTKKDPETPVGAAGKTVLEIPKELQNNEFVQKLFESHKDNTKKIKLLEDDITAKETKRREEIRRAQATSIVDKLIETNQVKAEDKDKEIKKYFELKNEDNSLKDLELLDNFLKSVPAQEKPIGASGYDEMPDFSGDKSDSSTISNMEIMGF